MKTFILYWIGGKIETAKGESISDAFAKAGYGEGAINALDFTEEKNYPTYKWDNKNRTYVKRSAYELFYDRNKRSPYEEIIYRARCVLGLRGVKDWETIQVNVTEIRRVRDMSKLCEDEIVKLANYVAEDTLYWM